MANQALKKGRIGIRNCYINWIRLFEFKIGIWLDLAIFEFQAIRNQKDSVTPIQRTHSDHIIKRSPNGGCTDTTGTKLDSTSSCNTRKELLIRFELHAWTRRKISFPLALYHILNWGVQHPGRLFGTQDVDRLELWNDDVLAEVWCRKNCLSP